MQRVIHRQVTMVNITSIEVWWDEDRFLFPREIVDAESVSPALPANDKISERHKNQTMQE